MESLQHPTLLTLVISLLLFNACSNDDCSNEPTYEYSFIQNQSIEVALDSLTKVSTYRITDGQSNVFEYIFKGNSCESNSLVSGKSEFYMEIPADSSSTFSYIDLEITETSAFYRSSVAPPGYPFETIEEGEIYGKRIDENTWKVSIDVTPKSQIYETSPSNQIIIDTEFSLK